MSKKPAPFAVGDRVTMLWGTGQVESTIAEIRPDQKAVLRREGRKDVVRSLAFLERVPEAAQ